MSITDALPMLSGVKIVDLTSVVFGPYATQILADYGAEVIKIETPTGDVARYTSQSSKSKGMSPTHLTLNRGKKSVALNLKDADDAEVMRQLIAEADIFIHNVRDEAVKRLGLGYDCLLYTSPSPRDRQKSRMPSSA